MYFLKPRVKSTLFLFAACGLWTCGPAASGPEGPAEPHFRAEEIESDFGVGYALLTADVDGNGALDIVAINPTQAVWFENPTWTKHVILDGKTEADNVCIAAEDIDGDGQVDLALGAAWRPRDTASGGTLQWISRSGDPREPWALHAIGFEPTLHRMRWADTDGNGKRELIVAPLHGRGTAPPEWWNGAGARLLVLRPPAAPATEAWSEEAADDSFHIMHNIWPVDFDGDGADEILTASYEGIHLLDRGKDGVWSRSLLGEGHPGPHVRGAGEVKIGRLANGKRYLATIEPWHAHQLVVYLEPGGGGRPWPRHVVASELGAGHALWCANLDTDEDEELVAGWREGGQGDFAKPGVAVFDPADWTHRVIDSGGMATEDATVADLNSDGRADIIAAGRATHNVKIYWNEAP